MYAIILILHVIVCFFLIFIVLIQSGKGAELGAAFGGSSQTLFGARGAATIFSKLTTIAAVIFMVTSLSLAVITAKGGSVVKRIPVTQPRTNIPVAPPVPGQGTQKPSLPAQPSVPGMPAQTAPQGAPASAPSK